MSSIPPGSNSYCPSSSERRIRKEWRQLTADERERFWKSVESAISSGQWSKFVSYHANRRSSFQAHATCAFMLWHRRFLLAMENMLRNQPVAGSECLTIPYWDIGNDHHRQANIGTCFSYGSCASGLFDGLLGGVPELLDSATPSALQNVVRVFNGGFTVHGVLIKGRPVTNVTDDGGHRPSVVRNDLMRMPIPESATVQGEQSLVALLRTTNTTAGGGGSVFDWFTRTLQAEVHDQVHNTLGGLMPTYVSTGDVAFIVWHSTMDWLHNLWSTCHYATPQTTALMGPANCVDRAIPEEFRDDGSGGNVGPPPQPPPEGVNFTPSAADWMIMEAVSSASASVISIVQDVAIGRYFSDIGLRFDEVADARSLNADNRYAYQINPSQSLLWKALWEEGEEALPSCETASDPSVRQRDFALLSAEQDGNDYSYPPYTDLDALIDEWVLQRIFPNQQKGDEYHEEHVRLVQRRQYLTCCILQTQGSILNSYDSQVSQQAVFAQEEAAVAIFWQDLTTRQETVRQGPERCHFLWPGAIVPLPPSQAPTQIPTTPTPRTNNMKDSTSSATPTAAGPYHGLGGSFSSSGVLVGCCWVLMRTLL